MSSKQQLLGDDWVTIDDFAKQVGRHVRSVHRWRLEANGLPTSKMGRDVLVHIPSARDWLMNRMKRPNQRRVPKSASKKKQAA